MDITKELAMLQTMTVPQLREYYVDVFRETTTSRHKHYLIRRILWGLQQQTFGGLSSKAVQKAQELADELYLRLLPKKGKEKPSMNKASSMLSHGNILVRKYKGKDIRVLVCENGFEYQGQPYKSLTAIVKQITGSHWSGNKFFGIERSRRCV